MLQLTNFLPLVTGRLYVDIRAQYDNLTAIRADVLDQSNRVIKAFLSMVDAVPWMDAPSKHNAHLKGAPDPSSPRS